MMAAATSTKAQGGAAMKAAATAGGAQTGTAQQQIKHNPPNRWASGFKWSDAAAAANKPTSAAGSAANTPSGSPASSQVGTARSGPGIAVTSTAAAASQSFVTAAPSSNGVVPQAASDVDSAVSRPATMSDQGPGAAQPAASSGIRTTDVVMQSRDAIRMENRMTYLMISMVGVRVVASLLSGVRYAGILSSINQKDMSVTLKVARQIDDTTASEKAREMASAITPVVILQQRDIVELRADRVDFGSKTAAPQIIQALPPQERKGGRPLVFGTADMARLPGQQGGFKTDADITTAQPNGAGRTLQKFEFTDPAARSDHLNLSTPQTLQSGGATWDQFAVNERQFGVKTDYNEDIYTTKLDRSAADYKDRERKAQKLADEILGSTAGNVHQAEERGLVVDDSGLDEEDKYSGVLRGAGAYVPPGARKFRSDVESVPGVEGRAGAQTAQPNSEAIANGVLPVAPVRLPIANGQAAQDAQAAPSVNVTAAGETVPTAAPNGAAPAKTVDQVFHAFEQFRSAEKEKLIHKRQTIVKREKDSKIAELMAFSKTFKVPMPVPDDLVPLLNNDRQRLTTEPQVKATAQPDAASVAVHQRSSTAVSQEAATPVGVPAPPLSASSTAADKYKLAPIPQWDPKRAAAAKASLADKLLAITARNLDGQQANSSIESGASQSKPTKFNVGAKEFVFRPSAATFTPSVGTPSSTITATEVLPQATLDTQAAVPSVAQPPVAVNPFFGLDAPRPIKMYPGRPIVPFTVKEDFAPSRAGEMPDPSTVSAKWGFKGESYKAAVRVPAPGPSTMSPRPAHSQRGSESMQGFVPGLGRPGTHHRNGQQGSNPSFDLQTRRQRVASPPPHRDGQNSGRMSRTSSAIDSMTSPPIGPAYEGLPSSTTLSSLPSSNTSQSGAPMQLQQPAMLNLPQHMQFLQSQQQPGIQQQFAMYQSPQYTNGVFRPGQTMQYPQALALQQPHLPHGLQLQGGQPGQMQFAAPQQFLQHMPMSPQLHAANAPVYSPALAGQVHFSPQQQFMQHPMYLAQAGSRPSAGYAPGQPQQLFYQQLPTQPGAPPQFAVAQQQAMHPTQALPQFEHRST